MKMSEIIVNYSTAREQFAKILDKVAGDHVPCIVTRKDKPESVILSREDYDGMMETLYLLSSPANVSRLVESIAELEQGRGQQRNLIDHEEEGDMGE